VEPIKRTLQKEAKKCQRLVLWLDCDREGENIAFEVIDVCKQSNSRIEIYRAHFSALIPRYRIHVLSVNTIITILPAISTTLAARSPLLIILHLKRLMQDKNSICASELLSRVSRRCGCRKSSRAFKIKSSAMVRLYLDANMF